MFFLGDDGRRLGVLQADKQRFVAEGREERLGDAADLEDAQEAEVELGDPVHEQADALAGLEAEAAEEGADGVRGQADVVVGISLFDAGVAFPDQGQLFAFALLADAVGAVPADVDDVARLVAELFLGDRPGEILDAFVVGADVRHALFLSVQGCGDFISRTTTAEARSLIWVSETSMAPMPWVSQNSRTLPWTKSSGLPRALLTTSISENLWPPDQPVPMALRKACWQRSGRRNAGPDGADSQ